MNDKFHSLDDIRLKLTDADSLIDQVDDIRLKLTDAEYKSLMEGNAAEAYIEMQSYVQRVSDILEEASQQIAGDEAVYHKLMATYEAAEEEARQRRAKRRAARAKRKAVRKTST